MSQPTEFQVKITNNRAKNCFVEQVKSHISVPARALSVRQQDLKGATDRAFLECIYLLSQHHVIS